MTIDPSAAGGGGAAAPVEGAPAGVKRGGAAALEIFGQYVSPLSALTLLGVIAIFALCVTLWDVGWLRPYLAAGGAGLAAFLGPIPGIVSPESRTKWLLSIFVAALITAGTWLATRDLEDRLDGMREAALDAERAATAAREATAAAREADAAHDAFVTKVLIGLPPAGRKGLFESAPRKLWSVYNDKRRDHKTPDTKDHQIVLDMALMLLEVDRENGHALYYAGEAYAKLGNFAEMIRLLQHYLASAEKYPADAATGSADDCYKRPNGYCAERVGWVSHLLADRYLNEALTLSDGERAIKLAQAFDYEEKAVRIKKWPPEHHHPGFDTGGITPGYSSCKILLTVAGEQRRLGINPTNVIRFGQEFLTTHCGKWPDAAAP